MAAQIDNARPYSAPHPAAVFLLAARQSRLCAIACPTEAETFKSRARYWLAMAGVARRAEGRRLP